MRKKHILTIGFQDYAFDSITQATNVLRALEKAIPVKWVAGPGSEPSYYEPEAVKSRHETELKMNQLFKMPPPPPKAKALPAPKRGVIRCQCGMADVAPRTACIACGTPFSVSHNRTHQTTGTAGLLPFPKS
jgi:hypothetical protein